MYFILNNLPPAQVQVLSAALKAAQLDSPPDTSPTDDTSPESLPEAQHENIAESLPEESISVEVQSEGEKSPTEEEQTMETSPASESCPIQERGDEETQTESPEACDSPILVRDYCLSVVLCYLWLTKYTH